jgi:hypothetical protein
LRADYAARRWVAGDVGCQAASFSGGADCRFGFAGHGGGWGFGAGFGEQAKPAEAVLTGTVLKPDGSGPAAGAFITLNSAGSPRVLVKSDGKGNFRASVAPGIYNIEISPSFASPIRINAAVLHEGEQILQPIRLSEQFEDVVTGGALAIEWHYTLVGALRHPLSYIKYLFRKV